MTTKKHSCNVNDCYECYSYEEGIEKEVYLSVFSNSLGLYAKFVFLHQISFRRWPILRAALDSNFRERGILSAPFPFSFHNSIPGTDNRDE
jgi:hypothetical protein